MATFKEFMRSNNVAFIKQTASGNGLNLQNESGVQIATIILNENTPATDEILTWAKAHLDFNCKVSGNFVTLSKVERGVAIASLWDEAPAKKARKVKA